MTTRSIVTGSGVATLLLLASMRSAEAGTITTVGAVVALDNTSQMTNVIGTGSFDEGPTSGAVPLNVYTPQGLTWQTGSLSTILPGVTNTGSATQPQYATFSLFPAPIAGGGSHVGQCNMFAGVATFTAGLVITQVGLTASENGTQYLTAWNQAGAMIGEVTWTPAADSAFVGIDTQGVPIGMIAYGNHDVWAGQPYGVGGATIISDTWMWGGGCTSDSQCNDGNPCTTDICSSTRTCDHVDNSASCNDGNACTLTDICQGGACVGTNPVTCVAQDSCHAAGVCDTTTGACSNPTEPNGFACNDGNACTQQDACQAGVCTGTDPVTCTPLDSCHVAGVCSPATGACSNPLAADGTACVDSNLCIPAATCMAGVCNGPATVCAPVDQCHGTGTCNPITGSCSNPALPDGTACNDGNACTATDACMAGVCTGANPVSCQPSDACHSAGVCDPMTGTCSNPAVTDGTACNDGNACTLTDACQMGVCTGTNPVVCTALDQCHDVGTCNTMTAQCSNPNKANGTTCNDGSACTQGDVCTMGTCSGTAMVCMAMDACHVVGTCDSTTGQCSNPTKPDGTSCTDNNSCFTGDSCQAGVCKMGAAVPCTAMDECHDVGMCDSTSGQCSNPPKANGTSCSGGGTCQSGTCERPDAGTIMTDAGMMGSDSGPPSGDASTDASPDASADSSTEASPDGGPSAPTGSGGGCGCRVSATRSPTGLVMGLGAFVVCAMRRRRRRRQEPDARRE